MAVSTIPTAIPDKSSEDKFKEINEALCRALRPRRRKQSDTYGSSGFHKQYSKRISSAFRLWRTFQIWAWGVTRHFFTPVRQSGGRGAGAVVSGLVPKRGDLELETDISFPRCALGARR